MQKPAKTVPIFEAPSEATKGNELLNPEPALRLCKCGRAPWRKGQRNCAFCNREANKRYRDSLKREEAKFAERPVKTCPA
jgi:hypothetical protein